MTGRRLDLRRGVLEAGAGAQPVDELLARRRGEMRQRLSRSWRPTAATSAPSAATPNVPPTMRLIDSVPEATPAFVRSTAFIAAVLIGDIVEPDARRPSAMNAGSR